MHCIVLQICTTEKGFAKSRRKNNNTQYAEQESNKSQSLWMEPSQGEGALLGGPE